MCFFSESWNNFLSLFPHLNLDLFWVLILQKRIRSRYLVPVTPTTVLSRSFWNFTGVLRMVWRYACGFFRILKLFFITGFLLQYLGKWYRTNGPLVNLPIFNTSNKNKAGDINSLWNLLVVPRLFEEKWRDTVFGFPWGVVRGTWRVVRGSEFLVGTLSP